MGACYGQKRIKIRQHDVLSNITYEVHQTKENNDSNDSDSSEEISPVILEEIFNMSPEETLKEIAEIRRNTEIKINPLKLKKLEDSIKEIKDESILQNPAEKLQAKKNFFKTAGPILTKLREYKNKFVVLS